MGALLQATLVCTIAWLYADQARGLVLQWLTSADASYGVILAVVACALIWTRRRAAVPARDSLLSSSAGFVLLAFGLTLYLAGLFAADLFTSRASFVFVAG